MSVQENNRTIDGVAKSVSEVMKDKKYSIDYYQREYKWESKQVSELIADLTSKFLELYDEEHPRAQVAQYPGYYLGSIIISQKGAKPFIVDGQQRLTSLTLLLVYLSRLQAGKDAQVKIDDLIVSEHFGEKSFNLDVADRNEAMRALLEHGRYEPPDDAAESVRTLANRYSELDELFPDELRERALPFFIDWLKERVQLVQITAYSDDDAYAIFETMNDRGLKLTPADMLKGFLLANIVAGIPRTNANNLWRKKMRAFDEREEEVGADFLKTWLRSQYARKIRQRKKDAKPEDWDRIGTEFHRWLRGAHQNIDLNTPDEFYDFIIRDFDFYSRQYERILEAASGPFDPASPLRFIRYNADLGFTLQYQLLLAPLQVDDSKAVVKQKLEIVGRFTDILLSWRIWNSRSTVYSTMQYAMFNVMRDIRRLEVGDLATRLHAYLTNETENFDTNKELHLHQQNRSQIHKILARLTDYITVGSGQASNYVELTNGANVKYEVEHIWANRYERHTEEFPHESDFSRHRNLVGDLLLLPKQFNASYGDSSFATKVKHYSQQNLLAASLNALTYEKNPGFLEFTQTQKLAFKPYEEFTVRNVEERGDLYRAIAKQVWNPNDLLAVCDPTQETT